MDRTVIKTVVQQLAVMFAHHLARGEVVCRLPVMLRLTIEWGFAPKLTGLEPGAKWWLSSATIWRMPSIRHRLTLCSQLAQWSPRLLKQTANSAGRFGVLPNLFLVRDSAQPPNGILVPCAVVSQLHRFC